MRLKDTVRAVKQSLPVTVRQEKWLKENANPVYSPEALAFAKAELSNEIGGKRARKRMFRASGVGQCPRQRMFKRIGVPTQSSKDGRLPNIFHTGSFLHLKWQMAGLTEGWLAKAEIAVDKPELDLGGTMDGVLYDHSGFEFKTIHTNGFAQVHLHGPKREHVSQVNTYMLLSGLERFSILYEDKNTQEWQEHIVDRDDHLIAAIEENQEKMVQMHRSQTLPEILEGCLTKSTSQYRWCEFRDVCLKTKEWDEVA